MYRGPFCTWAEFFCCYPAGMVRAQDSSFGRDIQMRAFASVYATKAGKRVPKEGGARGRRNDSEGKERVLEEATHTAAVHNKSSKRRRRRGPVQRAESYCPPHMFSFLVS